MTPKRIGNFFVFTLSLLCAISTSAWAESPPPNVGMIYWVGAGNLTRATADGADIQRIASELESPDGVSLDLLNNTVYWTNMDRGPKGSIQRAHLDGTPLKGDGKYLVQPGDLTTGKEIELDLKGGKMYWSDRDGMRIMRANLDGAELETLVSTFRPGDGRTVSLENPVGMALDLVERKMYFTDRYMAMIFRAGMDIPAGETQITRTDVEILVIGTREVDRPIDIDLDLENGTMYWTDRRTQKVLRANLDGTDIVTLVDNSNVAVEIPIGLSLDLASKKMYWSDVKTRKIHRANLDGSDIESIISGDDYRPLGVEYKAIEPEAGPTAGGQKVALLGTHFIRHETKVLFGKTEALHVKVINENLLTFRTPPGDPGTHDVTVSTPHGQTTLTNGYTYTAP